MANYLQSLINSESGGNWAAKNSEMGAGGKAGHFGRVQFGQARLQDAMNAGAIPQGTTPQQFMASPDLQVAAEKWHFADLESKLGPLVGSVVNGKPLDMGALVAMGHLGGAGGARKFVATGGKYNPSDSFGTSLSDYASKHGDRGLASDTMRAIGKAPTSSSTSTMNGADPMADTGGLLGQFKRTEENVGGLLGMLFKGMSPDRADSIRAAIGGMQGIDNAGMVDAARGRMQGRRQTEAGDLQYQRGLEAEQRGYDRQDAVTAQQQAQADQQRAQARAWIAANAPEQLAAFDAGMTDAGGVYKAATGADADPNVQSSAMMPDQSGTILTMRDGSTKVQTIGGEVLTGNDAIKYVQEAQARYTDGQRSIYGARETGKNQAQIETGGQAAAAIEAGKASPAWAKAFGDTAAQTRGSISTIDSAIAALDTGANSGIIYKMLPAVDLATATLRNDMNRMGLDVIGSVTFGALSAGEMELAMETAAPRNLEPAELKMWLESKRAVQAKAYTAAMEAAQHFAGGGSLADYYAQIRYDPTAVAAPPPAPSAAAGVTAPADNIPTYNPATGKFE